LQYLGAANRRLASAFSSHGSTTKQDEDLTDRDNETSRFCGDTNRAVGRLTNAATTAERGIPAL
jgi:hypothetical protein